MTHPAARGTSRVRHLPTPSAVCLAVLTLLAGQSNSLWAAQLGLAQVPAGNGGREPAPNIIISVDDSGSMGTAGMSDLRAALNNAFSAANIPDDSIRLGFQAMWRCRGLESAGNAYKTYGVNCPDNRVQRFGGTHRSNFNAWVDSLLPKSTTPSHAMTYIAGEYMKNTGIWGPYAHIPGVEEQPLLSCRKSFHIFMTDGEWNSEDTQVSGAVIKGTADNSDGATTTLPDGTIYAPYSATDPSEAFTRIYRDGYGSSTINTLADFSFKYWATDLQPTIDNNVRPIIRQAGPADFGTNGSPYIIPEYWNPKNNPATWQHLVTYTIGFKNAASLPTTRTNRNSVVVNGVSTNITLPAWGGNTWNGDFAAMIRGDTPSGRVLTWGNPETDSGLARRQELWHMAINGRGRFIPATNATELANAFAEIVNQIIQDTSTPIATIAANTQTITTGTRVYLAGYDSDKWKGRLEARPLTANQSVSATVDWEAGARLDLKTPANRVILTSASSASFDAGGSATAGGAPFTWSGLNSDQKADLKQGDSDTVGEERLDYLRGDRTKEAANGGAYRNRASRLGDIVNSNIWVTTKPNLGYTFDNYAGFRSAQASRPGMIYVGANGGMLHGFDVATGDERLAYVPKGVFSKLTSLTQPSYEHTYTVDGHPFTGDFRTGSGGSLGSGSNWRTALVSGLGGGGKGYFVLDVTSPGSFVATSAGAASTVLIDTTDGADVDIGHLYGEPVTDASNPERAVNIAKLNNGRWAAILGNGVNSTSEKAVLLIQYLDGDRSLVKIPLDSTGGNGNGLAYPQVIDIDGNGTADVAYAGDMLGNLWKIDLSGTTPSAWKSYFPIGGGTPAPLFVARDSSNARQPITTAPQWATHPDGGLMLAFGTGREMTTLDRTTNSTQTLYAVRDNGTFNPSATPMMSGGTVISGGRTELVVQTLTSNITINQQQFGKTSANVVTYTGGSAKRGWYLEFPALGERAVFNGGKLSDRLIYIRSRIPAVGNQNSSNEETCEPNATAAEEFMTVLDIVGGAPPSTKVFDTDGGGFTGTEEAGVSRWKYGKEDRLLMRTGKPGEFASISPQPPNNSNPNDPNRQTMGFNTNLRLVNVGWRQLQ